MYRCQWAGSNENMQIYHDTTWGVPEYDDQRLFRKLVLDMNQAGLSWQTIRWWIITFNHLQKCQLKRSYLIKLRRI